MMHPPSALAVIGHPVSHSLSPRFQNAALAHARLSVHYGTIDVDEDEFERTMGELAERHVFGNVTMPHKEALARLADVRTPIVERIGSANTFWFDDGRLAVDNTDVDGIAHALATLLADPQETRTRQDPVPDVPPDALLGGSCCAILGTGGSAAAVLVALERLGASEIRIWGRTPGRAGLLAERVHVAATEHASAVLATRGAAVVINTTPVGLRDDAMPIDPALLRPDAVVFDLVYGERFTPLVRAARARGLRADDGLRMLVEQGASSFERWFGIAPARGVMWDAVGAER